jgi:hypothetical protein
VPVEACLACYPQDSARLKPLIETAFAAKNACDVTPRSDFRAHARYEFRSALTQAYQPKTKTGYHWRWQLASVIPTVIGLLLISTGGIVAASTNSLPDQSLYGVKLAMEQIQLQFTPSNTAKTKLYALAADRRVGEIASMAEKGNAAMVESTTRRLADDLNIITGLVSPNAQHTFEMKNAAVANDAALSQEIRETAKGNQVNPPLAAAVTGASTTDGSVFGAAGPLPVPPQTVDVDPGLLKFLKENALKHPADLQALLDSIPETARPGLLQAIALTDNYQQVMSGLAANTQSNK